MEVKEKEKGLEVYELAEIIENSEEILWWGKEEMDKEGKKKQIRIILLKIITPEDAQRLEELGLEFSDKYCWRISESQNLPFTFLFDSAYSSSKKLPELYLFKQIAFRDKEQNEGRVFLFSIEDKERFFGDNKERLFGLARFGEKYDGVKRRDVEPGFFALVIFLKRESENAE